ncbi:hypothetical protein Bca52824_035652 [Brassica carinata]|uniref:Uncharacterized protein n=1 Tax=Brassica carinata TaxID=52824 RepID=A0A8X7S370_BRACI|nr:hypothetical protein Bca52824_035652 [Brassica carinata]
MWKFLMKSTGISVDPKTSMIYASPEWWDNYVAIDTEVPDTEENEEVYRVNIDDDSHPSNEVTHDAFGINIGRVMTETRINNTYSENDLDDTKTSNATNTVDGEYMARIRDNIANMLWEILNS